MRACEYVRMEDDGINGGSNNLKAWREFRHLTQDDLAELVGTTQGQIAHLEADRRGLSAKWLRKLAPALNTAPGILLDHDPNDLDSDIIEIWAEADKRQKKQLINIAKTIVRSGTDG